MHIILVAVVAFLVLVIWSQSYRTKARLAIGAGPEKPSKSSPNFHRQSKPPLLPREERLMKPGIAVSDPLLPQPTSEDICGSLKSVLTKS
jgi:hypothetical protein